MKTRILKITAALLILLFSGIIAAYVVLTGPRDISTYPDNAASPYLLPWPEGVTRFCVQGNRAVVSHRGRGEYSWDFTMPVGSQVLAARAGTVVKVVDDHDGHGRNWPNNLVGVKHDDGTIGYYLHLKKGGSHVAVGDKVEQGQYIAESGHVGNSAMPHLHFHVTDPKTRETIPVSFADVTTDRGVPRMLKRYTSGNSPR